MTSHRPARTGGGAFRLVVTLALAGACLPGCQTYDNGSFPLTVSEAKAALREMRDDPKPLARPVVIVGGYGDPGFATDALRKRVEARVNDDRVLALTFTGEKSFDECRERLIAEVDERFGRGVDVDVVANSMGGLIAAHAADPGAGPGELRVVRLFALASPFLGSGMAESFPVNDMVRDMQPGSEFLERLGDSIASAGYEIVPYVRLGDTWVGTHNTAPRGQTPIWVPNRLFEPAHLVAYGDPRFQADVLRRLRGETPFATEPRTPLPEKYRADPEPEAGAGGEP